MNRFNLVNNRFDVTDIAEQIFGDLVLEAYVQLDADLNPELVDWDYHEDWLLTENNLTPLYNYPITVVFVNGKNVQIYRDLNDDWVGVKGAN